jgi:hypothetical protein
MLREYPEYELMHHSADKPIVLAGPPGAVTGYVYLTNPGDQHVVVRSARLRDLPHPASSEVEIPMVAILRAGHGARTRLTVRLNSSMPPGHYETTLVLGNYTYPAVLNVTENLDFDIVPSQLIIENQPGTRAEKQVLFRNKGNVRVIVGSPEHVVNDEELMTCRILRGGLAEGTEQGASSVDQWLTAFLREAHHNVREAGMLVVRNKEGETIVPPGESRTVEFLIRQPDTLRPNTRYFSVAFFYTENLLINIVPGGASERRHQEQSMEPIEPRPVRKSKRPRSRT